MNLEIISAMYRLLFVLNIKAILLTSYSGLVNICFCFISVISDLQQILETKNNLALATVTHTKIISQKKNQTLSSIIRFRPANTIKTKMEPLS